MRYSGGMNSPLLFAFDLDGTLLTSKKEISDANRAAVRTLVARGHHIVIATARPPSTADEKIARLGIQTDVVYYNGALIVRADGDTSRKCLNGTLAASIVHHVREQDAGAVVSVMTDDDRWLTCDHFDFTAVYAATPELVTESTLLSRAPTKILVNNYRDAESLRRRFASDCTVLETDGDTVLQITATGASKEAAVAELAAFYGIDRSRVYCFGDDSNDIGMFRSCGNGVAMGNAIAALKAVAAYQTDTNDNDGVAVFIQTLLAQHIA